MAIIRAQAQSRSLLWAQRDPLRRIASLSFQRTWQRTFSSLPSLRPTLLSRQSLFSPFLRTPTAFQPTSATAPLVAGAPTAQSATTTILDLVPATAISTHPAFAGLGGLGGQQVRFGPRNTMQRNSRLLQKRRHGFLARLRSKSGRKILQRRRAKGRKRMSA